MGCNIIDALYWSNLASALKKEQQTLSSEQLVAEIQLCYERLRERMDKDTLEIFEAYDKLQGMLGDEQERQGFNDGFQIGARIMISLLLDGKK